MNTPIDNTTVMTTATALGAVDLTELDQSSAADSDEDVESVDIPDCIEPPTPTSPTFSIKLYHGTCLDCNALVQDGDTDGLSLKCHFSKGQTLCPAGSIRLVFTGLREYWLRRLRKAQANGGDFLLKEILKLQEKDADTRDWVLRQLGLLQDVPTTR